MDDNDDGYSLTVHPIYWEDRSDGSSLLEKIEKRLPDYELRKLKEKLRKNVAASDHRIRGL